MNARITEQRDGEDHLIRLEGRLGPADAALVRRLCSDAMAGGIARIIIDFDGLSFLDETSAQVLRDLKRNPSIVFRGCCLFTEKLIDGGR